MVNRTAKVRTLMSNNPKVTVDEVMRKTSLSRARVHVLMWKVRKELGTNPRGKTAQPTKKPKVVPATVEVAQSPDMVAHPPHYKHGGIETIDYIEAKNLNYNLGNVVKYISRADHKGSKEEDLRKAAWYLERELLSLSYSR